ncbi:outer membrane protein OmpA-like peptidoglycan-associated protein [Sphingopyxis italica]|uniref:Outer membrane protein OmpA-like peptidoglycan-associated protein n=1 Tax=Sphingopyxis italica TaxID=1129133 RepID=A0A7X5XWH7_9SPHN|nr:OmpA family protein [Sphingopyxis italica]NJB91521.1 outer membrane protein OmpA-like peptidoglycan-associated protein [Sphingopyxis italica]
MGAVSKSSGAMLMLAMLAAPATGGLTAQAQEQAQETSDSEVMTTVYGQLPSPDQMTKGPKVEGIISARSDGRMQVTTADGNNTAIAIADYTKIKSSGGFLGLDRDKLAANSLLNGLPVEVDTLQWDGGLVANEVNLKSKDLRTASMIHTGTDQRFAQQTAATEALRGRVGDIDQYNVKATTNVNFDTGKAVLTEQAKADLCSAANQAEGMDNALLLVVGYTDSTGSQELNQELSEKRAGRVVNHLQQACGWKPYRMLSPTGMAEADPAADNTTPEGKAQNRRVAVNILVSKGLDGM